MDDGVQDTANEEAEGSVKEGLMGGKEFQGAVEHRDPMAPRLSETPRPDHIPEKFWDPVEGKPRLDDLIKSYSELEKKIGQPKGEEAAEEDSEEEAPKDNQEESKKDPEGSDEENKEEAEEVAPELAPAIEAAKQAYAETGDLSDEHREPLRKAGISDEQIDFYLAGVKATEAALQQSAYDAAGSEDSYKAATEWAAKNWSEKKILAFNAQTGDVETIGTAVAGLMAEFRKAEPGEGQLANVNTGVSRGDVYDSMDEFQQELAKADSARDTVARKKAIDKLRRSREAGAIKSNRRQPFGG